MTDDNGAGAVAKYLGTSNTKGVVAKRPHPRISISAQEWKSGQGYNVFGLTENEIQAIRLGGEVYLVPADPSFKGPTGSRFRIVLPTERDNMFYARTPTREELNRLRSYMLTCELSFSKD